MKHKLSSNMSPKTKKAYLQAAGEDRVSSLLKLSANVDQEELTESVKQLGGGVRAWQPEMGTATVDIDANRLANLAELDAVVYIEVGEIYQS